MTIEDIRALAAAGESWVNMTDEVATLDDMDEGKIRNVICGGIDGGGIPEIALTEPISEILAKRVLLKKDISHPMVRCCLSQKK